MSVGGALRWQSGVAIGYDSGVDPESYIVTPILANPYTRSSELNGDLWFGYEKPIKLFNRDVDRKI